MMKAKAKDVMTKDVATVSPETTVAELMVRLRDTHFSGFPVVDGEGRPIGLITQNDVLRALALLIGAGAVPGDFQGAKRKAGVSLLDAAEPGQVAKLLAQPVRALMTPRVLSCSPEDSVQRVCALMADNRVHRVVVLEHGKVAGLVSATDVVRFVGKAEA